MDPTTLWWSRDPTSTSPTQATSDSEWDETVQLLTSGLFVYDKEVDAGAVLAMYADDSDSSSSGVSLNDEDVELVLESGGSDDTRSFPPTAHRPSTLATARPVSLHTARSARQPTPALSGTEEARRERNRLKVRRMYYRKLERLSSLRTEVSALEAQLDALKLTQHANAYEPASDAGKVLQHLAQTREQLQLENNYLRRVMAQYVRSADAVSVHLLELRAPLPNACVRARTVTPQACGEIRRQTLGDVDAFRRTRGTFTDVGDVCGWHSAHLLLDGAFKFMLEKTARGFRTSTVAALTWAILCDPLRFAKLYSRAVEMKCYVLQTIDADNVVLLHEFRSMDPTETHARVVRTILLVARVPTRTGVVFLLRSLDPATYVLDDPALRAQDETVIWNDLFCWLEYQDAPESDGRDCACSFAGVAPVVGRNVYFWMMEIVQIVVRWDALALGPTSYSLRGDGSSSSAEVASQQAP